MIIRRCLAVVVLIAAGVLTFPTLAAASAPTVCTYDSAPSSDVAGDLVVPADNACDLRNVEVHGRVTVGPGSRLYMTSAHVDGDVGIGLHGGVALRASTVGGSISLDYVDVLSLESGSVVGGDVRGTFKQDSEIQECDFVVDDSTVHGDLNVSTSGVYRSVCISTAVIGRDLVIADGALGIDNSTIGRNAVLSGATRFVEIKEVNNGYIPSTVCADRVGGNLTLTGSFSHVLLGGGYCPSGRLDVRGSLLINDNHNWVHVSAHVHGNVVCRRNLHHPIAGHPTSRHLQNIVDGHLLGQCTALAVRSS